jgi:hypothetical protein
MTTLLEELTDLMKAKKIADEKKKQPEPKVSQSEKN